MATTRHHVETDALDRALHDGVVKITRIRACPSAQRLAFIPLDTFIARCEPYFGWDGCIINQPYQACLPDGMIRCYMSASKLAGFGHQLIEALIQPPPEGPNSSEAQVGPADHARARCPVVPSTAKEDEWAPQMMELLAIDELSLNPYLGYKVPLWAARRGRYRHLYSVRNQRGLYFPIPNETPTAIARTVTKRFVGRSRQDGASLPGLHL
jgi:hypothetical protein